MAPCAARLVFPARAWPGRASTSRALRCSAHTAPVNRPLLSRSTQSPSTALCRPRIAWCRSCPSPVSPACIKRRDGVKHRHGVSSIKAEVPTSPPSPCSPRRALLAGPARLRASPLALRQACGGGRPRPPHVLWSPPHMKGAGCPLESPAPTHGRAPHMLSAPRPPQTTYPVGRPSPSPCRPSLSFTFKRITYPLTVATCCFFPLSPRSVLVPAPPKKLLL